MSSVTSMELKTLMENKEGLKTEVTSTKHRASKTHYAGFHQNTAGQTESYPNNVVKSSNASRWMTSRANLNLSSRGLLPANSRPAAPRALL